MKKLTSLALCAILASSMTAMSAFAQDAVATAEENAEEVVVDTSNVVQVNVMDGLCTLQDNAATNAQASDYPLQFTETHGTGRTTEDDAVIWENVTFDKDINQVAVKCGYKLSSKPGTGTEFWVYLNKVEGEPIAKIAVNDTETASSQIKDQVLKFADVDIKAGTYNVIVVSKTENSGSFSQVNFMYEAMDEAALVPVADALRAQDLAKAQAIVAKRDAIAKQAKTYGYFDVNVKEGECTLIDNAATNHQASDYPLQFAVTHGTGRTTEDDAVVWENVVFPADVKMLAVKCGYNLASKPGTGTEFWVYLNKIEGEPIAKVAVNDTETASPKIVDQVLKTAAVDIKAGTYDVIVVSKTENSGSVSQIKFVTDNEKITDDATLAAAVAVEEADIKAEAEKKAAEEAKKAEEEAKKAEEEKATEEAPADETEEAPADETEEAPADETEEAPADDEATEEGAEENGMSPIVIVIIVVVVVAVIGAVVVAGKKKK